MYELWLAEGDSVRPAGTLSGKDPQQLVLLNGPVHGATAVGITVEPSGGSPQPTTPSLGRVGLA